MLLTWKLWRDVTDVEIVADLFVPGGEGGFKGGSCQDCRISNVGKYLVWFLHSG